METISQKAWSVVRAMQDNSEDDIHEALVKIAIEQDRIARQEERERCMNTIREQMDKLLYPMEDIELICDHTRKAMEGSDNGND